MESRGAEREPWHRDGHPLVLAGEPRLVYQPVVDLGSGQLLGFEALLRWHHPTEGVILPPLLIPWAEANGDIVALGDWVLMEGCREATRWPASMQIAVNCSIVQLRRSEGSKAVISALEAPGLAADRLTIEVTEHAMSDEAAIADLRIIGALGVQLAVDDVGTSWNSFEILRRLAVNTVKIDDSFVMGLEAREGINRMIVETVVHLAHNCGMSTVAEGVETALHAAIVREFDSDAAQGYFFAPPLSQENATKMANLSNLRFPLDGPGWDDDDDWPFEGASTDNGQLVLGQSVRGRTVAGAAAGDARVEMDGIDLVDLVLDGAGGLNPPVPAATARPVNGNGAPDPAEAARARPKSATAKTRAPAKDGGTKDGGAKDGGSKAGPGKAAKSAGGKSGAKPAPGAGRARAKGSAKAPPAAGEAKVPKSRRRAPTKPDDA